MALTLLAANNAQTTIAAAINATATTVSLAAGTGTLFPAPVSGTSYFKLTLIDAATEQLTEIVHVTARSGDSLTILRGQEGTTARAWSANDIAANMLTAGSIALLAQYNTPDFKNATSGRLINKQVFSTPGSFTYNKTDGATWGIVQIKGAGGPGGNASGASASNVAVASGGGAGAYAESRFATLPDTASVVVGAGGTPGNHGGNSSFGSIVASGGAPGGDTLSSTWVSGVIYQRGGFGGTSSGGDINARGDNGGTAMYSVSGNCLSGEGGLSLYLGSAPPVGGGSGNGIDGDTGGGGSGANASLTTTVYTGGKGGNGIVIIWEYA